MTVAVAVAIAIAIAVAVALAVVLAVTVAIAAAVALCEGLILLYPACRAVPLACGFQARVRDRDRGCGLGEGVSLSVGEDLCEVVRVRVGGGVYVTLIGSGTVCRLRVVLAGEIKNGVFVRDRVVTHASISTGVRHGMGYGCLPLMQGGYMLRE